MNIHPRIIDPARTFASLSGWFTHDVIGRGCPGVLVGLSGTDSLVTFLAAYDAFQKAGMSGRLWGMHFAPSDDFLYDHPEAETHLWFSREIIPWLRERTKGAAITVDTSIDWRYDGLRWGAMADMSVVSNDHRGRIMRDPKDQYWVCGTRNRSEHSLFSYSNASMLASLQPLIHLWKSEVLQLSEYLGVPQLALSKSCETDCICGRERLPASHPKELDSLLMVHYGELAPEYVRDNVAPELVRQLAVYMHGQIEKGCFKRDIPYQPDRAVAQSDLLVQAFESGTLNLKDFNHRSHLYVAWYYLKALPFTACVERYMHHLGALLEAAGFKANREITEAYFHKLDDAMKLHPTATFDELLELVPSLLVVHKKR